MKHPRIPRRQQRELQRIYSTFFEDSLEYNTEHLTFLRLRRQSLRHF